VERSLNGRCSIKVLVFGAKEAPNARMSRSIRMPKQVDDRTRQSLRLPQQVWAAIDLERLRRAGSVSRNTWITEAILEKIARDKTEQAKSEAGVGRHA
jgi:hypothetical protein